MARKKLIAATLGALALPLVLASNAFAYAHVGPCQASARGVYGDDDIHAYGVWVGARSFRGFGPDRHDAAGNAYVVLYFDDSAGRIAWMPEIRCTEDYSSSDWIRGLLANV